MNVSPGNPYPDKAGDLLNPTFVVWLTDQLHGGPLEPDGEDYKQSIVMLTAHSKATDVYSNAQIRKFILTYAKWKASQN
jgi:hypothetical protein